MAVVLGHPLVGLAGIRWRTESAKAMDAAWHCVSGCVLAFLFVAFNLGPGDNLDPLLPLSKAVIAVPQAIVAATLIVLVVITWRDVCDPRLWTSTEDT
jgi:hypothetical protein